MRSIEELLGRLPVPQPEGASAELPVASVDTLLIQCPYCGESLEILVDRSVRRQEYIEDCQVCCQPMTLSVTIDDEQGAVVDARTEAD